MAYVDIAAEENVWKPVVELYESDWRGPMALGVPDLAGLIRFQGRACFLLVTKGRCYTENIPLRHWKVTYTSVSASWLGGVVVSAIASCSKWLWFDSCRRPKFLARCRLCCRFVGCRFVGCRLGYVCFCLVWLKVVCQLSWTIWS